MWAGTGSVSYLVFNVKGLPGLSGAKLRLWVTDPSQNTVQVAYTSSCFDESAVTWTTAPNTSILGLRGYTNFVFKPTQAGAWVEVGVGGFFGDGIVALALTRGGSDMAKFSSREGDHPPELSFDGVADTTLPTAQLTQPSANSTVSGITTIVASASDNADLSKVEFFRGGVLLGAGVKTSDGYVLDWDTRSVANGTLTLKARATDTSGNATTSKYQVTVSNGLPPTPPLAGFSSDTSGGVAPVSVNETDTSTGPVERWSWDFGDGSTSRLRVPPAHVYAKPGSYTITLTATNTTASTSTTQTINVTPFDRPNRLPGSTRILLMGNSITGNYCPNATKSLAQQGYTVSLIADLGIGLLSAIPDEVQKIQTYVSNFDPDEIAVEEIGNYDQSNSIDTTVQPASPQFFALWTQRAAQVSSIGLSRGALFWWVDNPPTSAVSSFDAVSGPITTIYHSLHAGSPALQYVDAYYPFGGPVLDQSLRTGDGVHLNAAGAALMSSLVVNAATTRTPDSIAPSAPALTASLDSSNRPVLSWSRSVDSGRSGLVGYKISRNGDPTPYADSVDPAALTFVDNNAPTNSTYSYVVAGYDAAGNQTESNLVSVFVPDNVPPSVPTLSGALNPDNTVGLSWTASTDSGGSGLTGYRIYRDGQSTPYATIAPDTTTYTDAGVNSGTTYTYTVTAFDGVANESQPSNSVSVTTP